MKSLFLTLFICVLSFPALADKMTRLQKQVRPLMEKELKRANLSLGSPVYIRIFKQEKILEVWIQETGKETFTFFKKYPICVFSGKLGPKLREGDLQAPEGFYDVTADLLHPNSRYHLAFNLGFPNEFDRARGRTGTFLMVHGGCESKGCYAMTDEKMEEIYVLTEAALKSGQEKLPVHIFPFYMTTKNFFYHRRSTWMPFWNTLRPAYEQFQKTRIPPKILVEDGQYHVKPNS